MPLGPSSDEVQHARDWLRKWSLGRYLSRAKPPRTASEVLVLSSHDTIRAAMDMLSRRGVLSAPVLDAHRARFLGFCGVEDIVTAFLRSSSEELMVVRHQIGPEEPGAPGEAALRAPTTPGAPVRFAELKARLAVAPCAHAPRAGKIHAHVSAEPLCCLLCALHCCFCTPAAATPTSYTRARPCRYIRPRIAHARSWRCCSPARTAIFSSTPLTHITMR
jgi:hypothetical protein